jgi:peroxiredoxin
VLVVAVHPQPQLLATGTVAPPIVLTSAAGQQVNALEAATAHRLVIEFFDVECETCQRQAAELCGIAARHPADVFVAVDAARESATALSAYARHYHPAPCPVTLLVDPGLKVTRAYRAAVVPTVYVVDARGTIAYGAVGPAGIDGAEPALRRLGG